MRLLAAILAQIYLSTLPLDHYNTAATDNPVTRLKAKLEYREGFGYLPSLLKALDIPIDSQALVFSKTSFQASKIGPRNPRAIYFNDEVAAGWVRGGDGIEVAALDPRLGVIFYSLPNTPGASPTFQRRQECLHCHHGAATLGVPGMFVGSVFPDAAGNPARLRGIITDHRTPMSDRWGGWFVDAARGEQPDRANAIAPDPAEPFELHKLARPNLGASYLANTSDIVALMVFEHQTYMTNLLTRLNWEARMGELLDADLEAAVAALQFRDEAPLKEPIEGASTFTKTFPQRGPRDRSGRSLRDFDLRTRLFRYPLSYMIYSPAFDALPDTVRRRIWDRLSLTPEVREILRDTKPDR